MFECLGSVVHGCVYVLVITHNYLTSLFLCFSVEVCLFQTKCMKTKEVPRNSIMVENKQTSKINLFDNNYM